MIKKAKVWQPASLSPTILATLPYYLLLLVHFKMSAVPVNARLTSIFLACRNEVVSLIHYYCY